jgi:flagellar hook-associated protein 2
MSGVTSSTGLFSGINSGQIIEQLLAIESRPKVLAQQRILQLQQTQAAYLDLNSKISALKTAAGGFRVNNVFTKNQASSSNAEVLSATASTGALPGSYQFIVDRLVSSQQSLSRGFASSTAGLNAGSFTFESAAGRLDRDTSLADLNGGTGIKRGKIVITDTAANKSATIDLSRASTVNEVIEAINSAPDIGVTAKVEGGRFVLTGTGSAALTVTNAFGSTTATSLGIERTVAAGATVNGSVVYSLGEATAISSLNDGNGVFLHGQVGAGRYDMVITVDGTAVNVNVGNVHNASAVVTESAPTTIGGVLKRINDAMRDTLGDEDIRASIAPDGVSIRLVDTQGRAIEVAENATAGGTTAADLGLLTTSPQTGAVAGRRILAGMNTTLSRTLNGGSGIAGSGAVSITSRNGAVHSLTIDTGGTLSEIVQAFNTQTGGAITASLNQNGTGISLTDTTGGTGNLIVTGATAESLGIATAVGGVASATVSGSNLQHQYITRGTRLASLRNGQGIGTGSFRITDSLGASATINIQSSATTVDDVLKAINSGNGTRIKARLNDRGDGILMYEDSSGGGSAKIKIEDTSGTVAANLNFAGEAAGTGAQNVLDGSFEKTVAFDPADSLQTIASKISAAGVGVAATIINDGTGSTPYRLSLTAKNTGSAGRFIVDTGSFDLGQTTLNRGHDARVFFGSTDPAQAVLLTSSRNTLDSVVTGVTIDLKSVSANPVTVTVSRDVAGIEAQVNLFISAFNTLSDAITSKTKYDPETKVKGPLLGDSMTLGLRSSLFSTVQGRPIGVSGPFDDFADVGITVASGGKLTLNRDKLRAALEQDPQAVADLFAARVLAPTEPNTVPGTTGVTFNDPNAPTRYLSQGMATRLENLAESYLNSVTGTLTRRNKTLTDQIALQNRRITDFDARLANRREILQAQFLRMEQAIGQLQTQSSALSQLG